MEIKKQNERIRNIMKGEKGLREYFAGHPDNCPVLDTRIPDCRAAYKKLSAKWDAWVKENNRLWLINEIMRLVDALNESYQPSGEVVKYEDEPITREMLEGFGIGHGNSFLRDMEEDNDDTFDFKTGKRVPRVSLRWLYDNLLFTPPYKSPEEREALWEGIDNLSDYEEVLDAEDKSQIGSELEAEDKANDEETQREIARQSAFNRMEKLMGR